MPLILLKALKWLVGKPAGYALALTAALALYAGYLYVSESYQAERERMEELAEARAEAQALYRELEALHGRLVAIAEGIERNREQWEAASRAIETLRSLMNRVERLFLPPEERAAQDEQLEAAQRERAESQAQLDRLSEERGSLRMKRAVAAEEARRLESRIEALESGDAVASAYLEGAWAKLSPYLLYALAALALGPIAIKAALYYGFAPLASRARPVALISERRPAPWLSQSGGAARSRPGRLDQGVVFADLGRNASSENSIRTKLANTDYLPCGRVVRADRNASEPRARRRIDRGLDPEQAEHGAGIAQRARWRLDDPEAPARGRFGVRGRGGDPHPASLGDLAAAVVGVAAVSLLRHRGTLPHPGVGRARGARGDPGRTVAGAPLQPGRHHRLHPDLGLRGGAGGDVLGLFSGTQPAF